ncbi:MAG: hypothetical protein ACOVOV_18730 [Dolichospermum sp.]
MEAVTIKIKTLKDRIGEINTEIDRHKSLENELIKLEEQQEELEEMNLRIDSLKDDIKQLVADLKQQNMGHIISALKTEILQLIDSL